MLRKRICACIQTARNDGLIEEAGDDGEYKLWRMSKGGT